jgi:hypothetical protein
LKSINPNHSHIGFLSIADLLISAILLTPLFPSAA